MTENAAEKLAAFERGLSALTGDVVTVGLRDDDEGDASVVLNFSGGASVTTTYWRLLRNGLAVVSSFDHKQRYGLPEPIDARQDVVKALTDQQVIEARLDRQTGDLLFAFSGRAHLQAFSLTGYEMWQMSFPDGASDSSNFVMSYLHWTAAR